MRKGIELEYCWKDLKEEDIPGKNIEEAMHQLGKIRALAKLGGWRAMFDVADKKIEKAFEECIVVIKLGRHFISQKLMIEKLVGIAVCCYGCEEIKDILKSAELDSASLEKMQKEMGNIHIDESAMYDMEGEALYSLAVMRQMFRKIGDNPIGWIIPGEIIFAGSLDETESGILEYYNHFDKRTPYQKHSVEKEKDTNPNLLPNRFINWQLKIIGPAFERIVEQFYLSKAIYKATVTVLAIKRWKLEMGMYPESLQALLDDGYLKELPMDPYSDGILNYQKRGDDFILYSLWRDFDDDGGVIDPQNKMGEGGGDYVFWPVK